MAHIPSTSAAAKPLHVPPGFTTDQLRYQMLQCSRLLILLPLVLFLTDCGLNVFPVAYDLRLGRQTDAEIRNMPDEYPIVSEERYPEAYAYLQGMVDNIVERGDVDHADLFSYEVTIIDKDIKNAFATPGGFIYVYTGLIEFLDSEDQLAGVMAHEIAHSAERHVTDQMTERYGLETLINLVSGEEGGGVIGQIANGLLQLGFSRGDESQADARSVEYLCASGYAADGAAGFFRKIETGGVNLEFLSTHPAPANRVRKIERLAEDRDCEPDRDGLERYLAFQRSLP